MRNYGLAFNKQSLITLVFLITLFLLGGCVDLKAVRDFAKISSATADYQKIVSDYVESPERRKPYEPERSHPQLEQEIQARSNQKPKLEGVQKILVEYMSALGDLANDELPNVDQEIDGVGKALEKAKFVGDGDAQINKRTAEGAGTIAKILTKAVLDHWRQKELKSLINKTDDSLQEVLRGLREVVQKDFSQSLDIESEAISKFFNKSIAVAKAKGDEEGLPPLANLLLKERLEEVFVGKKKLDEYTNVLDKIGKGHADLRKNVNDLENKELTQRLKQYSKDLGKLYRTIKEF